MKSRGNQNDQTLGTGIGGQEIPAFLQCRPLRCIDLTSTKVTAKEVQRLLALPELEEIFSSETAGSAERREQAAAAGVRLEVDEIGPPSPPKVTSGAGMFGGGPPDSVKDTEAKK